MTGGGPPTFPGAGQWVALCCSLVAFDLGVHTRQDAALAIDPTALAQDGAVRLFIAFMS